MPLSESAQEVMIESTPPTLGTKTRVTKWCDRLSWRVAPSSESSSASAHAATHSVSSVVPPSRESRPAEGGSPAEGGEAGPAATLAGLAAAGEGGGARPRGGARGDMRCEAGELIGLSLEAPSSSRCGGAGLHATRVTRLFSLAARLSSSEAALTEAATLASEAATFASEELRFFDVRCACVIVLHTSITA